jgi:RNA polymerase sigma factor (sigma-70 family)
MPMPQDDNAAWQVYLDRLVALARKKLRSLPRQVVDEEGIAASAIKSFLNGVNDGRFHLPDDADFDLWPLLAVIAARKCADLFAYLNAKKRDVSRVTEAEIDRIISQEPGPASAAEQQESRQLLLSVLKDDHSRQITQWKVEGYTNKEIAGKLDCSERTVERETQLIQSHWQEYLNQLWADSSES